MELELEPEVVACVAVGEDPEEDEAGREVDPVTVPEAPVDAAVMDDAEEDTDATVPLAPFDIELIGVHKEDDGAGCAAGVEGSPW